MYANRKPRKHPNALSIASLQSLIRPIIIFHKKTRNACNLKEWISKLVEITYKKCSRQVPYFAIALLNIFFIKYYVLVK